MTFHNFTEAVARRCFIKKVFLEILQDSQENTCARFSFLIKLQVSGLQLYQKRDNFIKKEILAQVFSCEFCEISKNIFFLQNTRWLLLTLGKLFIHMTKGFGLRVVPLAIPLKSVAGLDFTLLSLTICLQLFKKV